jgi:hypothetical protein
VGDALPSGPAYFLHERRLVRLVVGIRRGLWFTLESSSRGVNRYWNPELAPLFFFALLIFPHNMGRGI